MGVSVNQITVSVILCKRPQLQHSSPISEHVYVSGVFILLENFYFATFKGDF